MPKIPKMPDYKIETARQKGMFNSVMKKLISRDIPFDYINGVLSSKQGLGGKDLWFTWGKIAIIEPGDRMKDTRRGELKTVKEVKWDSKEKKFDIVEGGKFSED